MALTRCVASRGFGSPPASGSAITTPAITVTNNGDGTATVAITNSTGGTTNTVYYVAIDNQWGDTLTWTSGGSRTGNGNVTVTTGAGVFWFYVISTDGSNYAASNIAQKWISAAVESVWNQILDAVQARVRSLSLTGISSARVIVLTQADASDVRAVADSTGGVVICPGGAEAYREGDNQTDDLDYPVVIALVYAANQVNTRAVRETWMKHRERIRQSLLNQPLTTPNASIFGAGLRTAAPVDSAAWKAMGLVSPVMLAFWSNETRGI